MRKGEGQVRVKNHIFINLFKEPEVFRPRKKTKETPNRYLILTDGSCYEDIDFLLNIRKIFLIIRAIQQ